MADQCLFCRIVRGEIPATIVADTPELLAFRDINPQAPVHVVVVPKTHVTSLNDATDAGLLGRLLGLAAKIAKDEGLAEPGYRGRQHQSTTAARPSFISISTCWAAAR